MKLAVPAAMNSVPQAKSQSHQKKSPIPSERQRRILQTLAAAETPLSTIELRGRVGLFRTELQADCSYLRAHEFVGRHLRRLKQTALNERALKPIAFWFLTEKGAAWLGRDEPAGADGTSGPS